MTTSGERAPRTHLSRLRDGVVTLLSFFLQIDVRPATKLTKTRASGPWRGGRGVFSVLCVYNQSSVCFLEDVCGGQAPYVRVYIYIYIYTLNYYVIRMI